MILIFGASYGILVASKLMLAGYNVTCVCKKEEADLINEKGFFVEFEGYKNEKIIINSNNLIGKIKAVEPHEINLDNLKLVVLAMQEAQYNDYQIYNNLVKVAKKKIPTISIMNIPPSIFLKNYKLEDFLSFKEAYKNYDLWNIFDINFITHGSADPQIFKPYKNFNNYISVRLASNFRITKFKDIKSNEFIEEISKKIKSSRYNYQNKNFRVPVYINLFNSFFVPISKWPMLITGNYRCLENNKLISIHDAVNNDVKLSEKIYNEVQEICKSLGASNNELINFENYLKATRKLNAPSSVARLAFSKVRNFERLDKLIKILCEKKNIHISVIDKIIKNFDKI